MSDELTAPNFRRDGCPALVSGAGRGLGVGMAKGLARSGAHVVVMSRTRADLESVSSEIAIEGGTADVLVCDVTNDAAVQAAIDGLPTLDILVNNAGTNIPQPFVSVESSALDTMLNLHVRAAFVVAQAAVNRMLRDNDRNERGGAVVNISSQLGRVALRDRSVYTLTKHALEGLTTSLAIELAPKRIRVNAVGPTWVETPMTGPALADPDFRSEIIGSIPMGHLAQVDDIVGAVVFLASPAASMITGASLVVDGGWTAR